jgi:hypothetical protein
MPDILRGIEGFEWDEGNSGKSEKKHGVTDRESEEIFFNKPLIVARSSKAGAEIRLRQPAFGGGIHRSRQKDSRDQRTADEQKREENI